MAPVCTFCRNPYIPFIGPEIIPNIKIQSNFYYPSCLCRNTIVIQNGDSSSLEIFLAGPV